MRDYARTAMVLAFLATPAIASASAMPHYRLYTNVAGGGWERAGSYFPHNEFYDSSVREAVAELSIRARPNARVASETPGLVAHYAQLAGRSDLVSISLSDKTALRRMTEGDYIMVARGRRYFSNDALVQKLQETSTPAACVSLGIVPSINIFALDENSLAAISAELE